MAVIERILDAVALPEFLPAKQHFDSTHLDENGIATRLREQFAENGLMPRILSGQTVAITAGSRGICNIAVILRELVALVRERGAFPYILGCMGSHGGDADGQMAVLAHLGITESFVGASVVTSDNLSLVGTVKDGRPVFADASACDADALIVVNRVKPHTAFHAPVESGLQKMLAIGLGKQRGADACHARGFDGMYENVIEYAATILGSLSVPFGVAVIENAHGQVADCVAVAGEDIQAAEPALLERARRFMPRLPWESLDTLIVSEMGKDISGSGMDTNIIGRYPTAGMSGGPDIGKIVVLDLTAGSEGNAHGVGFADFISSRLFKKIDFDKTYPNCLTNKVVAPAKIPPVMPNDKYAIAAAVKTCPNPDPATIKAVWIQNTHALENFHITPALAGTGAGVTVCGKVAQAVFGKNGEILSPDW